MTTSQELLALADRCEVATGQDVIEVGRLNADILRALGWSGDGLYVYNPAGEQASEIPSLTTSLDAALLLVWTNDFWRVGSDGEGEDPSRFRADIGYMVDGPECIRFKRVVADTAPLALCAAALQARAAQEGSV